MGSSFQSTLSLSKGRTSFNFRIHGIKFLSLVFLILFCAFSRAQQSWIRINQLGYLENDVKVGVFVTKENINVTEFELVDAANNKSVLKSNRISVFGAYAVFQKGFRLNFSSYTKPGKYYLRAANIQSPIFKIGNDVYDGTADFLLKYMRQQRSKYNPFLKDSCHTEDGFIVYHPDKKKDSTRLDVAGGWHDASDYLQYLPTSANATYQMMFAYLHAPESFSDKHDAAGNEGSNGIPDIVDEAKWGLDWMIKMNPAKGEYYNQIADDRDHAKMRLPTLDSVTYSHRHGFSRPVYFITGKPQGEKYVNKTKGSASSVAKFASAFALGAKVMKEFYPDFAKQLLPKAKNAYAYAKAHPGNTQTISMKSPYIYAEDNYVDDLELAATTLNLVSEKKEYVGDAISFAKQEPVTPWMGADTANHYQWYPFVNLGHYWGSRLGAKNGEIFQTYMKEGIDKVKKRGASNPFLMGVPFIWCSNNLVAGILTQTSLYREMHGTRSDDYAEFEASLRDWLFGCNPWGTSMICDLPEGGEFPEDPHSAFTHLYNYKISGGLVDGPVYGTIWNRLIGIKLYDADEFEQFQSPLVVYHDDYGDYSTNEPTMDGTASLTYYLGKQQQKGSSNLRRDNYGAIIQFPSTEKNIYLLFSAHDFGEGGDHIAQTLQRNKVAGNFFFTGDFLRDSKNKKLIQKLVKEGHYIGSHSDKHLLYNDWGKRDSLLVTKKEFETDLQNSISELNKLGIKKGDWYLPPYEWYNEDIVKWSNEKGLRVINFTPGVGTNADYTTPYMKNYRTSAQILQKLFDVERQKGLAGNIVLIHLGTDEKRTDKLYYKLDEIIEKLSRSGYKFSRLPYSGEGFDNSRKNIRRR